jgi:hypothetical protein
VLGWVSRLLLGGLVLALLVVGGTAFRVWQVARVDDRQPVDAVVVLGAAQYDGDPSRIFESRCGTPRRCSNAASRRGS